MQQLLSTVQAGERQEEGGTDGWMDGWMTFIDVCFPVTVALQYSSSSSLHASLRRPLHLTLCPFDILFISVSLSLHLPPLCPRHSLLLSHFLFPSLIYYSHPSLTFSLFPLTPEIPPSAPGRLDLHQQCFPPRKRNRMMNKRTERRDR